MIVLPFTHQVHTVSDRVGLIRIGLLAEYVDHAIDGRCWDHTASRRMDM